MKDSFIQQGAEVLIVGGGRSGLHAALLAGELGGKPVLVDDDPSAFEGPRWEAVMALGARVMTGVRIGPWIRSWKGPVIMSPGVPPISWCGQAVAPPFSNIRGELEWAASLWERPIVAIAGTNGKSTTTALVAHLLKNAGFSPFVGGNFGTPFSEGVRLMRRSRQEGQTEPFDVGVIEVSSFQTESMQSFSPEIYLLLNITPDHLDRYDSLPQYRMAKLHLATLFSPSTTIVWNSAQEDWREWISRTKAHSVFVGSDRELPGPGIIIGEGTLRSEGLEEPFSVSTRNYPLIGGGNLQNLAFSVLATVLFCKKHHRPLDITEIEEGIASFSGLPHRMERVNTVRGVTFVNDSKATNVGAVEAALSGLPETGHPHVVLIMGGRDKGGSYRPLIPWLKKHVREVVVIGEAREKIREELGGAVPMEEAQDLFEAVARAFSVADSGEMVLLSPACSSYDMFHGYEERGDRFREAVRRLSAKFGGEGRSHGAATSH